MTSLYIYALLNIILLDIISQIGIGNGIETNLYRKLIRWLSTLQQTINGRKNQQHHLLAAQRTHNFSSWNGFTKSLHHFRKRIEFTLTNWCNEIYVTERNSHFKLKLETIIRRDSVCSRFLVFFSSSVGSANKQMMTSIQWLFARSQAHCFSFAIVCIRFKLES